MALNASCVPMLMLDICTRRRHRSCGDCHLPEAGLSCSSRRNVMTDVIESLVITYLL